MSLRAHALSFLVATGLVVAVSPAGAGTLQDDAPQTQTAWTYEGLLGTNIIDATVVTLADGTYRMYYAGYGDYSTPEPTDGYIASAVSSDGLHWVTEGRRGLSGGWPRVITLPDGRLRMYYSTSENVGAALSSDGLQWTSEQMSGLPPATADFAWAGVGVVRTDTGYRMYYSVTEPSESYRMTGVTRIYSATSTDGLAWQTEEGIRIDPAMLGRQEPAALHPDVIRHDDGTLEMYFWTPSNVIWTARSTDGINFTQLTRHGMFGADPCVVRLPDGGFRVYLNHLESDFTLGAERQRFWSYRTREVPFGLTVSDEIMLASAPSTTEMTVQVTGSNTAEVTVSAELWWNLVRSSPEAPEVIVDSREGAVPFSATVKLYPKSGAGPGSGVLVITADDGTVKLHQVIKVSTPPPGPALASSATDPG